MGNGSEELPEGADQSVLAPIVCRALGVETAEIGPWRIERVSGGVELGSSIYRLSGEAEAVGHTRSWTLILKQVRSPSGIGGDPQAWRYWRREALAYSSGVLDDLPGRVYAPRCYAAVEQPGGGVWLWLEDVRDAFGGAWPLEHYCTAARCLGQFNGAYLAGRPLPEAPWVTHHWLRQYLENAGPAVDRLVSSLGHPLLRRALPGVTAEFIRRIWEERLAILDAIERLPQTFCHLDAFRRNLFARRTANGGDQVIAIDWSYSGIAAVGEEIAPLAYASWSFGAVPPGDALRLEQLVLEGYVDGLRAAGWQDDPDLVRFSYAATAYWRYGLGGFAGEMVPYMLDEHCYAAVERAWGKTMEELADDTAAALQWAQHMYEQATKLKAVLRL